VGVALEGLEADLLSLEELSEVVLESLDNATRDVPTALTEASRALAAILNISLGDLDLELRRREVEILESRVFGTSGTLNESNSLLVEIRSSFSTLNISASETLLRSRELNMEANELLNRSRAALLLANASAIGGNRIIAEARELLIELRSRLSDARNLSAGLEEVIRNVERAENLSLVAEGEAERAAEQIRLISTNVNTTVDLLVEVSVTLRETMEASIIWKEFQISFASYLSDISVCGQVIVYTVCCGHG
jgi:hypothetical protein